MVAIFLYELVKLLYKMPYETREENSCIVLQSQKVTARRIQGCTCYPFYWTPSLKAGHAVALAAFRKPLHTAVETRPWCGRRKVRREVAETTQYRLFSETPG